MSQRLLLLAGLALVLAGEARAQSDAAAARITVRLPAEAKLYVDGVLCPQTSDKRAFDTPRLEPGRKYNYTLKAELVEGGKTLSLSKTVSFTGGDVVEVDFGDRAAFVAAAGPAGGPTLPSPTPAEARTLRVKGAPPRLLTVVLDKDGLIQYQTTVTEYVPETFKVKVRGDDGKDTEVEQKRIKPVAKQVWQKHDPSRIKAYRADGTPIPSPRWSDLIKGQMPVVMSQDGEMLDPFFLKFLNPDVLILVPEVPPSQGGGREKTKDDGPALDKPKPPQQD